MRKLLILVLAVIMLLSALPFAAFAADEGEMSGDEGAEYEYHDEKIDTRFGPDEFGKDWRDYKSYMFYEYDPDELGYGIEYVKIIVTEDFIAEGKEPEATYFPRIENKINRIVYVEYGRGREYSIDFNWEQLNKDDGTRPVYTEEMIDEYISILRYLSSFSFIETIRIPIYGTMSSDTDPIDSDTSDSETTESETTEPVTTEPVETEPETTEPETEAVGAVAENSDDNGNELNNPQTGDMFFVYLSVLLLSTGVISVIAAVIMKRKFNR